MDYDLNECKKLAVASYDPMERSRIPKRFLTFMREEQCDKFIERAIDFARVCIRLNRYDRKHPDDEGGKRTILREHESVTRLLHTDYVKLVRDKSWPGRALERANRADNLFFEALFKLTDAVLEQVFRSTKPADLHLVHRDINRIFRTPNFNCAVHRGTPSQPSKSCGSPKWRDLPNRRRQPSKRMLQAMMPKAHRSSKLLLAVNEQSPLISTTCPSATSNVKMYNQQTKMLLRSGPLPGTVPGMPPRCQPTRQSCITGKCRRCSPARRSVTQTFYRTKMKTKRNQYAFARPDTAVPEGIEPEERALIRGFDFDACRMGREKTIDYAIAMMQDLGLFKKLDVTEDTFTSFLIDVRTLHTRRVFTNWSHSVNVAHMLYYLLTVGGLADHFAAEVVFLMFVAALCSGINFPTTQDPIVVTSENELWMIQREGSHLDEHYSQLHGVIMSTGSAPYCNIFAQFSPEAKQAAGECLHACITATHILPMSSKMQQLHKLRRDTPSEALRGAAKGKVTHHVTRVPYRSSVKFQESAPGEWWQVNFDLELMQLVMMASWMFYPSMAIDNGTDTFKRWNRELFAEGDALAEKLPRDVTRSMVIPSCMDRKALSKIGAEERVHSTFVELLVLPLYRVLEEKTDYNGKLDLVINQIKQFHRMLVTVASGRLFDEKLDMHRSSSLPPGEKTGIRKALDDDLSTVQSSVDDPAQGMPKIPSVKCSSIHIRDVALNE